MKKTTKVGWIVGLATLSLAAVVGVTAYFTNWFTDTSKLSDLTKTGTVVESFKYDSAEEGFVNKDGGVLNMAFTHEMGNKNTQASSLSQFKEDLHQIGKSNSEISSIWGKLSSLDEASYVITSDSLSVSLTSDGSHSLEVEYFDTIRINYSVPTNRYVAVYSVGSEGLIDYEESRNFPTGKTYQEISIMGAEDLVETVGILSAGLNGAADTRLTIDSIELVRKDSSKADKSVYFSSSLIA